MKTTIISIINQKGGVGKSTTALALAGGLARIGHRVLAIDLDAQVNLSFSLGANTDGPTILDVLTKNVVAQSVIQSTETCDVIPASKQLAGADAFISDNGSEYLLKNAIQRGISKPYDYIVIDTPPALGILTINALTASTTAIIPIQADIFSLNGVDQLAETIQSTRENSNPTLAIDGILLTRYNTRGVLNRQIAELAEQLATSIGTRVYKTRIRDAVVVRESQMLQQSVFAYAPNSNVVLDYKDFIEEFTENRTHE